MRALISMGLALGLFVTLLRIKVKIGWSMIVSALTLAAVLQVMPRQMWQQLVFEWDNKPISQTTGYLFISLTALVLLVNVLGAAMRQAGVSQRLVPAMQGLFKSRRLALSIIPLMMGMLPTPGGIMLSAPMVRDLGDQLHIDRTRLAAINFYFRHQWEPVWPLFPAIPLAQGILGISALSIISANSAIWLFGMVGGAIFLLLGIGPRKSKNVAQGRHLGQNLADFTHAFWPIALAAALYAAWDIPPALGILIALFGFLILHKRSFNRWTRIFKAANEPDIVLLVGGALFFKLNLEAGRAIPDVMALLAAGNVPPYLVIFFLPLSAALLTGITSASVAITFPLLAALIGTGAGARIGLEALAFSGLLCGLLITPVHLCLPLSAGYFQVSLPGIIVKLLLPVIFIAAAGVTMAVFFG